MYTNLTFLSCVTVPAQTVMKRSEHLRQVAQLPQKMFRFLFILIFFKAMLTSQKPSML